MAWGVVICAAIVGVIAALIVRAVAPDRRQNMRNEKTHPEAMPDFLRRVRTAMFRAVSIGWLLLKRTQENVVRSVGDGGPAAPSSTVPLHREPPSIAITGASRRTCSAGNIDPHVNRHLCGMCSICRHCAASDRWSDAHASRFPAWPQFGRSLGRPGDERTPGWRLSDQRGGNQVCPR